MGDEHKMPGNHYFKQLQPFLKSPYGGIILLLVGVWVIARLSPEQFKQLCEFWPYLNSPIGWGLLGLIFMIWLNLNVVKPLGGHLKTLFNAYIDKERDSIKIIEQVNENLSTLKQLLQQTVEQIQASNKYVLETVQKLSDLLGIYGQRHSDKKEE